MPADNYSHLAAAATRRSANTRQAAVETLRRLDAAGTPITFTLIASEAGVSRSWLYRDRQIRAEIERLRTTTRKPTITPATQRATDASLRERIETLLDDNRSLRQENRHLREQIATLLGRQRVDNTRPRSVAPIGPCN